MARTLADLEADIRFLFDIEGFTARHSQAAIFRRINAAYRTLRDRLTSAGCPVYLTSTEVAQATAGRTVGHSGTVLSDAVMTTFAVVDSIAVRDGLSWVPLRPASASEAPLYGDGATTGIPEAWAVVGVSAESGTSTTGQHLAVLVWPPLDVARTFRVKGLQAWVDLTTATDAIPDTLGALDYCIAAVGVDLATRDDDVALHQARTAEREAVYRDVLRRAKQREPGTKRRVDVRGRR